MQRLALVFPLMLIGCCPPCPDCPPCLECEDGFHLECIKDPEPGPQPEDYLTLERVGACENLYDWRTCTGLLRELGINLQENAWTGWRDPIYVADHCSWACEEVFEMSCDELRAFGAAGEALEWGDKQGDYMRHFLPKPNRHGFEGRSWVRKDAWEEYNANLNLHLALAIGLQGRIANDPECNVDSIKGWCECKNGL